MPGRLGCTHYCVALDYRVDFFDHDTLFFRRPWRVLRFAFLGPCHGKHLKKLKNKKKEKNVAIMNITRPRPSHKSNFWGAIDAVRSIDGLISVEADLVWPEGHTYTRASEGWISLVSPAPCLSRPRPTSRFCCRVCFDFCSDNVWELYQRSLDEICLFFSNMYLVVRVKVLFTLWIGLLLCFALVRDRYIPTYLPKN